MKRKYQQQHRYIAWSCTFLLHALFVFGSMVAVTDFTPDEAPVWVSQKRMAFHRVAMKSTTAHTPQVTPAQTLEFNELVIPTLR